MLGDDITGALPGLRAEAESLMLDVFQIWEPGARTIDADGIETVGPVAVGQTIGRLAGSGGTGNSGTRTVTVGDTERTVIDGGLHLPVSSPAPRIGRYGIGWEYELITAGPDTDPALVSTRWLAVGASAKSYMTARRLDVVQLDQPAL